MVSKIESTLTRLNPWLKTSPSIGSPSPEDSPKVAKKSIGEVPPTIVDLAHFPDLVGLFTQYGLLTRIRRKLITLSGKKGQVVLATGTIGAADNKGLVYVGAEFLRGYQDNPALIAGVLSHEWGHLVSNLNKYGNLDTLSWDELFRIRQEEEASADAFCGRNMPLMGYSVEPLIQFLLAGKDQKPNHKYYSPQMREAIIREAAQTTFQRQDFAKRLFGKSVYKNPYTSILIVA